MTSIRKMPLFCMVLFGVLFFGCGQSQTRESAIDTPTARYTPPSFESSGAEGRGPVVVRNRRKCKASRSNDIRPLVIDALFPPNAWMGCAAVPGGPVRREVCRDGAYSAPSCEKWRYQPTNRRGEVPWFSIAYTYPPDMNGNFGSRKGMDLRGRGFTRLTFMAKGARGGERLIVRSGGGTSHNARFPASHDTTIGVITLEKRWRRYEIPLGRNVSLKNVVSVISFTGTRAMTPADGMTWYIDDIMFRGPEVR